ncbi:NADH dehydrogenase-like protein / Selenide,water dikinase [Streptomyces murinus]
MPAPANSYAKSPVRPNNDTQRHGSDRSAGANPAPSLGRCANMPASYRPHTGLFTAGRAPVTHRR